jgi:4,5-DOPA dioxygenase extradiol
MHPGRRLVLQAAAAAVATSAGVLDAVAATKALAGAPAPRQPALFIGHGSPLNALADNAFTRAMAALGKTLGRPRAILVVSAHWLTPGSTLVDVQAAPPTIHDFGGFPQALHDKQYPAPGHPELARTAIGLIRQTEGRPSTDWGLDHGTWCVLSLMFPKADVPVFQVSIDYTRPTAFHLALGRELAELRRAGVLIVGSGNVVHNLRRMDRGDGETSQASQPWAAQFDDYVAQALSRGDDQALLAPQLPAGVVQAAVPTPDHYFPLLYAVGAGAGERVTTIHEGFQAGTISMRAVRFG